MQTGWMLLVFLGFCSPVLAAERSKVESLVQKVDSLRESLAQGVTKEPDQKTFKQVCSPVGLNIKNIARNEGVMIRQVSHKNRNPRHKPTKFEQSVIELFQSKKKMQDAWIRVGGREHFFYRIQVQENCLACHGSKESRPEFVKEKYPNDKAFDFQVGDLRGLYHVKQSVSK